MNSRDAAYDEEEQLRRAIEASKGEKSGDSTDGGTTTRRGKRGRSDSEEYVIAFKGDNHLLTMAIESPMDRNDNEQHQGLLHRQNHCNPHLKLTQMKV